MPLQDRVRVRERVALSDVWATRNKTRLDVRRRDGTRQKMWREKCDRVGGAAILPYDLSCGTVLPGRQFRRPAFAGEHGEELVEVADGRIRDGKTVILLQYAAMSIFQEGAPG